MVEGCDFVDYLLLALKEPLDQRTSKTAIICTSMSFDLLAILLEATVRAPAAGETIFRCD